MNASVFNKRLGLGCHILVKSYCLRWCSSLTMVGSRQASKWSEMKLVGKPFSCPRFNIVFKPLWFGHCSFIWENMENKKRMLRHCIPTSIRSTASPTTRYSGTDHLWVFFNPAKPWPVASFTKNKSTAAIIFSPKNWRRHSKTHVKKLSPTEK